MIAAPPLPYAIGVLTSRYHAKPYQAMLAVNQTMSRRTKLPLGARAEHTAVYYFRDFKVSNTSGVCCGLSSVDGGALEYAS